MLKKITKIIAIVIISFWLFTKLFDYLLYPMITFWGDENTRGMFVKSIIEEALHIPYQHYKSIGEPSEYKEGWQDLEPISDDEWFSMKCEHQGSKSRDYFISFLTQEYLSREQRRQVHCVSPTSWASQTKHCTSIFNCPSIQVTFFDYILQYPKVLDNVIKIMEKPCDYLSDDFSIPARSDYEYTREEWNMLDAENKIDAYIEVKHNRNLFYCDKFKDYSYQKDRTYSVIYIIDKDSKKKTEIIVPRKDDAHLVK